MDHFDTFKLLLCPFWSLAVCITIPFFECNSSEKLLTYFSFSQKKENTGLEIHSQVQNCHWGGTLFKRYIFVTTKWYILVSFESRPDHPSDNVVRVSLRV